MRRTGDPTPSLLAQTKPTLIDLLVGPRVLGPNDVHNVEERTAQAIGESVELSVRARTDVLVTGKRYQAVGDVHLPEEGADAPTPEVRSP